MSRRNLNANLWRFPNHESWVTVRVNSGSKQYFITNLKEVLEKFGLEEKFKEGPFSIYLKLEEPLTLYGQGVLKGRLDRLRGQAKKEDKKGKLQKIKNAVEEEEDLEEEEEEHEEEQEDKKKKNKKKNKKSVEGAEQDDEIKEDVGGHKAAVKEDKSIDEEDVGVDAAANEEDVGGKPAGDKAAVQEDAGDDAGDKAAGNRAAGDRGAVEENAVEKAAVEKAAVEEDAVEKAAVNNVEKVAVQEDEAIEKQDVEEHEAVVEALLAIGSTAIKGDVMVEGINFYTLNLGGSWIQCSFCATFTAIGCYAMYF
ncbi:hypothetical protein LWI29_015642 [Acer saccharum]|uniref:Uncharacterized protein n=1 Tax=Acer saccharum TaxID=4024 RepID=A0AA39TCI4_ACESA|nr:hypothetical protein LWI29_015642 [Acer saccharum]